VHHQPGAERAHNEADPWKQTWPRQATAEQEQTQHAGDTPHQEVSDARQRRRRFTLAANRIFQRLPTERRGGLEEDLPEDFQNDLKQQFEQELDDGLLPSADDYSYREHGRTKPQLWHRI
jgi:D-serine dehydratase